MRSDEGELEEARVEKVTGTPKVPSPLPGKKVSD